MDCEDNTGERTLKMVAQVAWLTKKKSAIVTSKLMIKIPSLAEKIWLGEVQRQPSFCPNYFLRKCPPKSKRCPWYYSTNCNKEGRLSSNFLCIYLLVSTVYLFETIIGCCYKNTHYVKLSMVTYVKVESLQHMMIVLILQKCSLFIRFDSTNKFHAKPPQSQIYLPFSSKCHFCVSIPKGEKVKAW